MLVLLVVARSADNAVLVMLAWPHEKKPTVPDHGLAALAGRYQRDLRGAARLIAAAAAAWRMPDLHSACPSS